MSIRKRRIQRANIAMQLRARDTSTALSLRSSLGAVVVDRPSGIIRDVSIIALGEAVGHGFFVDGVMLSQVYDAIKSRGGRIPVRCTHPEKGEDPLPSLIGEIHNVRLDTQSVRGDLHLLPNSGDRERILDIAERMPSEMGLSIEVPAQCYSFENVNGAIVARVRDVSAADLVGRPAANPRGLLSQPKGVKKMTPEMIAALRALLSIPESIADDDLEGYVKIKAAEAEGMKKEADKAAKEYESMTAKEAPAAPPAPAGSPNMGGQSAPSLSEKEIEARLMLRMKQIRGMAAGMKLSAEWAETQIAAGLTLDQACANAIDERKRQDGANTPNILRGNSGGSATPLMLEAALCQAAKLPSVEKLFPSMALEKAHEAYKGRLGVQQLILEHARAAGFTGWNLRANHREALQLAFSTSSIAGILSNVANKFMLQGYEFVEAAWRAISAIRSASDFKTMTSYRLTVGQEYKAVGPGGEIQHGNLGEESYTNKVDTYGLMLAITRQDQINDDMGALTTIPQKLGRLAALKINDVFWTAFIDNLSFFTAARGNFDDGADSVLGVNGLSAAEVLFDAIKDADLDSGGTGNFVGANAKILLVPTALDAMARQLMTATEIRDTTSSTKYAVANPHSGKYTVVKSRYLTSATKWYLLADPRDIPVIETAFLNGQETPTVETADADFNTLGIQMRGFHDFGVTKQDWRGGVGMAGA